MKALNQKQLKKAETHLAEAVQLRQVNGRDWGWYSNEDPRMHLQTLDTQDKIKYWLEASGSRICNLSAGKQTARELKIFEEIVSASRRKLDGAWIELMLNKGWLTFAYTPPVITLQCYPGSNHLFTRQIDLTKEFPGAFPRWFEHPPEVSWDTPLCALVVGEANRDPDDRNHFDLTELIFTE